MSDEPDFKIAPWPNSGETLYTHTFKPTIPLKLFAIFACSPEPVEMRGARVEEMTIPLPEGARYRRSTRPPGWAPPRRPKSERIHIRRTKAGQRRGRG